MKNSHDEYTFLIDGLGSSAEDPDGGVRAGALGVGSLISIPLEDLPMAFLAFF
jgi:hypothetical protein